MRCNVQAKPISKSIPLAVGFNVRFSRSKYIKVRNNTEAVILVSMTTLLINSRNGGKDEREVCEVQGSVDSASDARLSMMRGLISYLRRNSK